MQGANPYQSLVSLLSNVLEAYTTAFFIFESRSRQLHLAASQSLSRHLPETVSLSVEQSGILAQVLKVGQTIHLEKLPEVSTSLTNTVPFYREGESYIKGLFAVPVGDGSGVLYVDTKYGWGFNDKQQKWIKEVADVLHEIMQKEEQLHQQEDCNRILQFWWRLDEAAYQGISPEDYCTLAVSECAQFLGTDYGFLALREVGKPHYRLFASTPNTPRNLMHQPFPTNRGLAGWIFRNRKPLLVAKLNPDTSEHFLFAPGEGLPHQGSFWAIPSEMALGHTLGLMVLSRSPIEWDQDHQTAMTHLMHFFSLYLEKSAIQEEYEHLRTYDATTSLLNAYAFEGRVEKTLTSSMQESTPFTLALLQIEPWRTISTHVPPKITRRWQRKLAGLMCEELAPEVLVGLVTENRFGFLFPDAASHDTRQYLSRMVELARDFFTARMKGVRMHVGIGVVNYPQDGTRSEELWPLAYSRLYSSPIPRE